MCWIKIFKLSKQIPASAYKQLRILRRLARRRNMLGALQGAQNDLITWSWKYIDKWINGNSRDSPDIHKGEFMSRAVNALRNPWDPIFERTHNSNLKSWL